MAQHMQPLCLLCGYTQKSACVIWRQIAKLNLQPGPEQSCSVSAALVHAACTSSRNLLTSVHAGLDSLCICIKPKQLPQLCHGHLDRLTALSLAWAAYSESNTSGLL